MSISFKRKEYFENNDNEKNQQSTKNILKYPACKELHILQTLKYPEIWTCPFESNTIVWYSLELADNAVTDGKQEKKQPNGLMIKPADSHTDIPFIDEDTKVSIVLSSYITLLWLPSHGLSIIKIV